MSSIPQASRAAFDFLAALGAYGATTLYEEARTHFEEHSHVAFSPTDYGERLGAAREVLGSCGQYRYNRLIQRMTAEQWQPLICTTRERLRLEGALPDSRRQAGGGTIELHPELELPAYFTGVTFHNQPRDMIYVTTGPAAHPHGQKFLDRAGCAAVRPGNDLLEHRTRTAAQAPLDRYARILDVGCGHGTWTATLQRRFPSGEIHAIDLWPGALEATRAVAAANGWHWTLKQAAGEATGYSAGFFDLVTSYAVLHEVPVPPRKRSFAKCSACSRRAETCFSWTSPRTERSLTFSCCSTTGRLNTGPSRTGGRRAGWTAARCAAGSALPMCGSTASAKADTRGSFGLASPPGPRRTSREHGIHR